MINLGIIGYPLGHTLSPLMHKAALEYLGIKGDYVVLETPPDELVNRIKFLKINNFKGFNVTIPHKVSIIPFLDEIDNCINVVGAVNTVIISENKKLKGFNTDIYGFINAISLDLRESLSGKKVAVLGVGGAARAVAAGLIHLGVKEIVFYARDEKKALSLKEILIAHLRCAVRTLPDIKISIKEFKEFDDLSYASLVVNATPLGMYGVNEDISPLSRRSIDSLPDDAIVYDLIYRPKKTRLLEFAEKRGLKTVEGTEMLILQGAKALSIWINQDAPVEIMREVLLKNL